mmetsp:Transcript_26790/g.61760  ORF Transcript_26790/g.61760 Transcript_26790/m.61760 type:complete len:393 (+) Transcript_26790:127-1305(+)
MRYLVRSKSFDFEGGSLWPGSSLASRLSTAASSPELFEDVCRQQVVLPLKRAVVSSGVSRHVVPLRRPTRGHLGSFLLVAASLPTLASRLAQRVSWPYGTEEPGYTQRDDGQGVSIAALLAQFEETPGYLPASRWQLDAEGMYQPTADSELQQAGPRRTMTYVPSDFACKGVTEVQHISLKIEGASPVWVMDVLLSPSYGTEWNPNIAEVLLSKQLLVDEDTSLPDALHQVSGAPTQLKAVKQEVTEERKGGGKRHFEVVGQVIHVPLSPAVERLAGGPRFSGDWIVSNFSCETNTGYMLSTSQQTQVLADLAGVALGQDMCMSAVLVAPADGGASTQLHWMQHLNPNAPGPLRGTVLSAVAAGTERTIEALANKAREVSRSESAPSLLCRA